MTILWMCFIVILLNTFITTIAKTITFLIAIFLAAVYQVYTWESLNSDEAISHHIRVAHREKKKKNKIENRDENKNEKSTNASSRHWISDFRLTFRYLGNNLLCKRHHSHFKNHTLNWLRRRYSVKIEAADRLASFRLFAS